MIKQIINWTAGGFFRTLGKLLLFIVIGLILGYFISIKNIRLPLISFGKVYADTFSAKESRWIYDVQGTDTLTSWQTIPYTQNFNWPVKQGQYRLRIANGWSSGSSYKFKISYLPGTPAVSPVDIWFSDIDGNRAEKTCTGWVVESNNYYATTCVIEPAFDISSSNYMYVRIVFAGNGGYVGSMRSYVGDYQMSLGTAGAINNQTIIINNELQEQTEKIQDILDLINDNNITQQENEFDDMIDDLQFSSEGAIETIIMLPINLIASIINPSNQNLCFTLNSKQVCFPNGSIIWGRSGCSSSWFGCPDFNAFKVFFQLIGEGFIIWYLLKRIVYTFENITDPTKSTTEVMKL